MTKMTLPPVSPVTRTRLCSRVTVEYFRTVISVIGRIVGRKRLRLATNWRQPSS